MTRHRSAPRAVKPIIPLGIVAAIALAVFAGSLTGAQALESHGYRSGSAEPAVPGHDVSIGNCVVEGPPPVILSDVAGANMYVICNIANSSDHDDDVIISPAGGILQTALPAGCTATAVLLVPGRTDFVLPASEQKQVLYKLRFVCHSPAVESIVPVTIGVGITHPNGSDENPANNAVSFTDTVVIGQTPTPSPSPVPTPNPAIDDDGDGYTNGTESHIGTAHNKPCGSDWPANLVNSGLSFNKLDIQDLTSFAVPLRRLGTSPGNPSFDKRWDLVPGSTVGETINAQDLASMSPGNPSSSAYPPMFGGQQAFGKTCPSPP
jgi:hypothetical protein